MLCSLILTITLSPMFCPNTKDPLEVFVEDLQEKRFNIVINKECTSNSTVVKTFFYNLLSSTS